MKRTNVVLDEQLLEEAVRVSGERTYARTIERALEEMVRRAKDEESIVRESRGLLVDTSAWVEVFRRPQRVTLLQIADDPDRIVTCLPES